MSPLHILILEDLPENIRSIRAALEAAGRAVQLDVAHSAKEFFSAARDQGIDFFLLGFDSHDGSPLRCIERAKAALADRPVLIVSARRDQQSAIESFRNGAWDFIPRHLIGERGYLWERIDAALNRRQRAQRKNRLITTKLLRKGETDALTGLFNRHHFKRLINHGATICTIPQSLCCIMLDLDNFKLLNDTHGHGAGDQMLKAVANSIVNKIGAKDIVSRWGGEEFVIAHACDTLDAAISWTEDLRRQISELRVNHNGKILSCTASAGITHGVSCCLNSLLIEQADEALYLAKRRGRNRICTWEMVRAKEEAAEQNVRLEVRAANRLWEKEKRTFPRKLAGAPIFSTSDDIMAILSDRLDRRIRETLKINDQLSRDPGPQTAAEFVDQLDISNSKKWHDAA